MKLNLRKSKGFTLVELLLVVGIIALGSVVAYITLPKVQSTSRANAEATNINTIAAGVKNMYAGTNSFTTLGAPAGTGTGTDLIVKGKAAPDRMVVDPAATPKTLVNSFGGNVAVGAESAALGNIAANGSYFITYAGVPDAECNKLATGVGNNFVKVQVNSTVVKSAPGETLVTLDPAVVSGACVNSDNNAMTFWNN